MKQFMYVVSILICLTHTPAIAAGNYMSVDEFLVLSFGDNQPEARKVWLKSALKEKINRILGHPVNVLRIGYWDYAGRTAWILEEIGKDQPITMGFAVEEHKILVMEVLEFRESRGWEIRYPFFTDQFRGAGLAGGDLMLDREIDGISGATLSVKAASRLARMALMLHEHVTQRD